MKRNFGMHMRISVRSKAPKSRAGANLALVSPAPIRRIGDSRGEGLGDT